MWASSVHACMEKGFLRLGCVPKLAFDPQGRHHYTYCTRRTSTEVCSTTSTHMADDRAKDILCLKSSKVKIKEQRFSIKRRMQDFTRDASPINREHKKRILI